MRGKRITLTPGQRFGRYVVVERGDCRSWICRCDCGTVRKVLGGDLVKRRAAGCIECRPTPLGALTHGSEPLKLYQVWSSMRQRCGNPKNKSFHRYGARGITVCAEWNATFESFREWSIKNGYREGLSIERIDNDKGYSPENCTWASAIEQGVNTRRTRRVVYRGNLVPIATLAHEHGIPIETLNGRLKLGWPIDHALSIPVAPKLTAKRAREMGDV